MKNKYGNHHLLPVYKLNDWTVASSAAMFSLFIDSTSKLYLSPRLWQLPRITTTIVLIIAMIIFLSMCACMPIIIMSYFAIKPFFFLPRNTIFSVTEERHKRFLYLNREQPTRWWTLSLWPIGWVVTQILPPDLRVYKVCLCSFTATLHSCPTRLSPSWSIVADVIRVVLTTHLVFLEYCAVVKASNIHTLSIKYFDMFGYFYIVHFWISTCISRLGH